MTPVRNRFGPNIAGLIRLFAFCLIATAMVSQIAHRSEFEVANEVTLTGAVSAAVAVGTDGAADDTVTDICAVGFSCHTPALLVVEEIGLTPAIAAAPDTFTNPRMRPGQSVDVPLPPPLTRRA